MKNKWASVFSAASNCCRGVHLNLSGSGVYPCAPGHFHFPAWLALVLVLAIVIAVIAFNAL